MIYLDNFSTTFMDTRVYDTVMDTMKTVWANPHSVTHCLGWHAGDILEASRRTIAHNLDARPCEVVFTSGATEGNNMVIKGLVASPQRTKILVSSMEHACVLEASAYMERHGYTVSYIPVDADGMVDMESYTAMLDDTVALVSVMLVNNEIGTVQDVKAMCTLAHAVGALFHTDTAQAVGKIPVRFGDLGVDFMSVSGHKLYGPKGIGCVLVKQGASISPLLHGGGQERGVRAGTVPVYLVAGLARAIEVCVSELDTYTPSIKAMRDSLESYILRYVAPARVLGENAVRVAGACNIYVPHVAPQDFFSHLDGVCVSSGSACASAGKESSRTLRAMGISPTVTAVAIRMCVGRFNTHAQIDDAGKNIIQALETVQKT